MEWRKADKMTTKLMCQVANREKEGCLKAKDMNQFPCEDLQIIDQLWVYYSVGKYGFSVQKKLWLECGGEIGKYDYEVLVKFMAKAGWGDMDRYLKSSILFPSHFFDGIEDFDVMLKSLLSHVATCKL
jgi:hypothetical protein